jgi:protoheme IX farnesyltransferase
MQKINRLINFKQLVFFQLTKSGINNFVVLVGIIGYGMGLPALGKLDGRELLGFALALYCLSGGSLALNQVQEVDLDRSMSRTRARPIPSGRISKSNALAISLLLLGAGLSALVLIKPAAALIGLLSVVLYNGFYTYLWKPKWVWAAVPGAIPGALPVLLGYAVTSPRIFTHESVYLFLVMFLWQMPHFWALALRYREDYALGSVPTLPTVRGIATTLRQIGMYSLALVALALAAPLLVPMRFAYVGLILPACAALLYYLYFYLKRDWQDRHWFKFFLCVNTAMLVFIAAPVVDKILLWK